MAVKTIDEIMESVKARIGDDTSDDALSFVEDVQDTLHSLTNDNNENWKQRYEENDRAWRQKYRDRFFKGEDDPEPDTDPDTDTGEHKPLTFDNLFKEE